MNPIVVVACRCCNGTSTSLGFMCSGHNYVCTGSPDEETKEGRAPPRSGTTPFEERPVDGNSSRGIVVICTLGWYLSSAMLSYSRLLVLFRSRKSTVRRQSSSRPLYITPHTHANTEYILSCSISRAAPYLTLCMVLDVAADFAGHLLRWHIRMAHRRTR